MATIASHRTPHPNEPCSPAARWASETAGVALAFLWGLAEATFFFVVPDVLISLAAMTRPVRAWRQILAATAGALLGGALLYGWSARHSAQAQAAIARVPFVRAKMLASVHASFQKRGMGALFLGPMTGTPYKIYALEAPQFLSLGAFLAATVPARAERFLFVWAAFAVVGIPLRKRLQLSFRQVCIVHSCFWVLLYAFYWGRIVLS